ncbi:hypothetical protein KM043_006746 [Ampulex compressa]|nr:hypothetical protein KM043_006746 [Ampulex compressa]
MTEEGTTIESGFYWLRYYDVTVNAISTRSNDSDGKRGKGGMVAVWQLTWKGRGPIGRWSKVDCQATAVGYWRRRDACAAGFATPSDGAPTLVPSDGPVGWATSQPPHLQTTARVRVMPPIGTIMTIDAGSPATASTSVFEENMSWSRSTGGSTSSTNEAHSTLNQELAGSTPTGDRLVAGQSGGGGYESASQDTQVAREHNSGRRLCGLCGQNLGTRGGDTAEGARVSGASEDTSAGVNSTTDSVGVGASNGTVEEEEAIADGELLFGLGNTMEDLLGPFNDSLNESLPFPWNGSLYNETYIVLGEGMYPSGYTLPHIVLASILATLLMIVIVVGNMLVIIAIATEKALKNIQNWFIASLAVADFFLGLVIMPFSLANEIMGYWIFGYWWCDIYSAMDVLLCTASIMNLCLISLDRFWSITQAVEYLKKRTPARAALMIALVWLLSALVCIPPLLGWKRPTPEEEYPKCKMDESRAVLSQMTYCPDQGDIKPPASGPPMN